MFTSGGGLGQTIAVVDRSGRVVSTSKHLMNILKEAKYAYNERKAEITSSRKGHRDNARIAGPRRAQTFRDDSSVASSHRSHRDGEHRRHSSKRRHSGDMPHRHSIYPDSDAGFAHGIDVRPAPTSPAFSRHGETSPSTKGFPSRPEITQRHTTGLRKDHEQDFRLGPTRSMSTSAIDMDLAYGEVPPGLFNSPREEEDELGGLVGRVKGLLDEANCLQYSVTTTIATLQKNPDAMAAVALTLAEISNLLKKMGPGALLSVRRAAPAVFALLSSPQFLIAAGVGVGITIVAFGGFKIVKKIQARQATESADEMMEIGADVSRIDTWRRGIAVAETESVGTSVEGEFITPAAASLSRLTLGDGGPTRSKSRHSKSAAKGTKSSRTVKSTRSASSSGSKTSTKRRSERGEITVGSEKKKEKKPSPLRLMFT